MIFAFDLDGTLSRHPASYRRLMASLRESDGDVIVLTAAAGELPPEKRPAEVIRRLAMLGIFYNLHYDRLICCETRDKGRICAEEHVAFIFDDSPEVVELVRKESVITVPLQSY